MSSVCQYLPRPELHLLSPLSLVSSVRKKGFLTTKWNAVQPIWPCSFMRQVTLHIYDYYQCVTVWEIWVASVIWWQHWNQFLKSSTSIKKIFCMYMIYRTWMKLTISFSFGNFVRKTKPTLRLVLKQSQNNSPWHIHSLLLYTFGDCWKGLHKKLCI